MNDALEILAATPIRPELPTPTRTRWQPLRLGLVELFHYDSEEFWFRDGHLLLRGNNGTGKSKVLSLTLPFLFDAQLKASRIEPDGDVGKRMAWNLLLGTYDRRVGYAWIELGMRAEDGTTKFLTLGAGLAAAAARPQVESWFFVLEGRGAGPRIGQDLWLTNAQRIVLTKERLREAVEGHGQVFDTAAAYRRAVDERLFHLGTTRYAALMDTLIQLRQPQLSKKPDEGSLSRALTEALPPLASELLSDVAEALNQLEEDRRQLHDFESLAKGIDDFNRRYHAYTRTLSRRQARVLRQAQTEFDSASRTLNEKREALRAARESEELAWAVHSEAELEMRRQRAGLDTLRADPAMQDANRLDHASKEMGARQTAAVSARAALDLASSRLEREVEETRQRAARAAQAEHLVDDARRRTADLSEVVGVASAYAENPLATPEHAAQVMSEPRAFDAARRALQELVDTRREHIGLLRRRHEEVAAVWLRHAQEMRILGERQEEARLATERRRRADADVERHGEALVRAWEDHFERLRQLAVDADAPLAALADWVARLDGNNPARAALLAAQQRASLRLAERRAELGRQQRTLADERAELEGERYKLQSGEDAAPPAPYQRDPQVRQGRSGAPLWQLIEFREHVDAQARAGLEAALEVAGLLDAWIGPDGRLQTNEGGTLLHDTQVRPRPSRGGSLAEWLEAADIASPGVPPEVVTRVLEGIPCGNEDKEALEAWIAPDGRFRLGALTGAWAKPVAVHIGFAARAAARARRLSEISKRLAQLGEEQAGLETAITEHERDARQAESEWHDAPDDDDLRAAHLASIASAREVESAAARLAESEILERAAEAALRADRQALVDAAADLRLPEAAEALAPIEAALDRFSQAQHLLVQTARDLHAALLEHARQQEREAEARDDRDQAEARFAACRIEAEEALARLDVLREAVGARVEALQKRIADAEQVVRTAEQALKAAEETRRKTGEVRAVASIEASTTETLLQERAESRTRAVAKLQGFAATGLLSAALPDIELPALGGSWTIDPALTLARRAEQALSGVKDDDEAWARVQRQIAEGFTELQGALTALGQRAQAEPSDFGLLVHIIYQNRPERPDLLAVRLAEEISQRRELLTANEREILENHLQAEIAAEVQKLLQAAELQIEAINKELHRRPTSTGVRFRLQWLPLAEGAEGAPVGLEAARKRLLNTDRDLWSLEDRRVVGAMLQQRIAAERERTDASLGREGGVSLLDQLARALDYRRWHEFRVQRWQDGQWRKLSGPASSGERALGLTVPLFAAVASFYSQSGYAHAPRLVLLDEAFAGIDDSARAHCMALIREFELDFVITSEREWGCYGELPGVSICQLQRREGIEAIFVSRWTWDGRAKIRETDPDRRFPDA
ncbi:MAG: TIGR02680 family protein [Hyphomicrobiales bacterium]|nr:TIGR02680 family protein [Hyphomicrobiales bacterium]